MYHRVGDARYPSTNISTQQFEAHLRYLKDHQYRVVNLSEAIKYLRQPGEYEKVAVITIDDGYKSFFNNGFPLLKQYGFTATLFVNTETVGGNSYMNWEDLRAYRDAGMEIGNHTHSHGYFLDLAESERYAEFKRELEVSQRLLRENLDIQPKVFAYPFGEFDERMKDILKEAGFDAAAAQNSGVIHAASDMYALPRFPIATGFGEIEKFSSKARMRALKVEKKVPESYLLPAGVSKPVLELVLPKENLLPNSIQCFVQSGECTLEKKEQEGRIVLKATSATAIKSRRTLYTITVQDADGNWHWFSHLWIDTGKR